MVAAAVVIVLDSVMMVALFMSTMLALMRARHATQEVPVRLGEDNSPAEGFRSEASVRSPSDRRHFSRQRAVSNQP